MYLISGDEIQTKEDVKWLISSLIFRQLEPYTREDILTQAEQSLKDSKINLTKTELCKMLDETIDVFLSYDIMSWYCGAMIPNKTLNYLGNAMHAYEG